MIGFMQPEYLKKSLAEIPKDLSILPLRNIVAFPFMMLPLSVGIPRSVRLIEDALKGDHLIGLLASKDGSIDEPVPGQIYEIGTVAKLHHAVRSHEEHMHVVVEGLERFRLKHWLTTEPYLQASIDLSPDIVEPGIELDALMHSLRDLAKQIITLLPNLPEDVGNFLDQVEEPRYLIYMVAANSRLNMKTNQRLLEMDHLKDKYQALIYQLTRQKEVLTLGRKIQTEVREKMSKAQREYYLREQLKAIKKELGETDDIESEAVEYAVKIEKTDMSEEARKEAQRELKRMKGMAPQAAEYAVIKTYLDWLLELPWNVTSQDQLDVNDARSVLDEDHYDLQDVKNRIIEYLAVRKLVCEREEEFKPETCVFDDKAMGAILCFVGPPGVGKTSLGQSIARALGRKFTRMSLGGMRDEAEIRGHRRTYIGAMPGRIIQAIKRAGTRNPVFMLDEVDKIGTDWRGDPSSALLEVLDPAQNHAFRDHYLDVDFDLSDVMFITTANQLETIPPPLRDRMEIIHLEGYTEYEKIHIAKNFLVPRQLKANGLRKEEAIFTTDALRKIIQSYTREAGVRTLERQIGTVCRKVVVKIAAGESIHEEVTPTAVRGYLKKEKFESEASEIIDTPGIATGLAVTATGGDILFIEATRMPGKGKLTLTGQLGDVMRESAQIAHSYVRSKTAQLEINSEDFEKNDVHLHVPAGAIPKDGPSAGIAMVTAIASLFSGKPVHGDVGMTGEVTLRGRVLSVGGIKMKVLAAHRAGITTVVLPRKNEPDLEELPEDVRNDINFIPIEQIDEALKVALAADRLNEKNKKS
ncbi:MAG: endopeptidase La [Desulfobacterales bacterium]|jgi:ATP-dependent Lon protease